MAKRNKVLLRIHFGEVVGVHFEREGERLKETITLDEKDFWGMESKWNYK